MEVKEKIQRSVASLEAIYAVVIGFAIKNAIESALFDPSKKTLDFYNLLESFPGLVAFLATIVPFYHGMHRHLSKAYIEEPPRSKQDGFLLLDFFVFFFEACILLVFASLLNSGIKAFMALSVLLAVDLVWGIVAHRIHYGDWKNGPWKWSMINFITVVLFCVVLFFNLLKPNWRRFGRS